MPFLAQKHFPIPNKDLLSWMFDDPGYDLNKPIYMDAVNPSRSLSSNQARVIIRKLVAGFRAAGLKKGDCVCVHSFNDIYYSILFLGIVAAGGVYTGTNPSYTPFELSHHLNTSRAKFIIAEPELLDTIEAAAKDCKISDHNLWGFSVHGQSIPQRLKSWSELLSHGEDDWVKFNNKEISSRTPAALLFSSGTTGLPKAAVLSHYNLVAQHTLAVAPNPAPYEIIRLLYLPMFHAAIVPIGHTTPLKAGNEAYVMRRFDLEIFFSSIQRFNITEIAVVPPIVLMAIASPLIMNYDLTSVKSAVCGAASLGKVDQRQFEKHLAKNGTFNQVWGMTETSCVAARLVDEDDKDITATGAKGELLVRGPTIISGYYENPAANTAAFDAEGYFRTGDIVSCEGGATVTSSTAKWYMVDRKKELIKVRGFQVSPAELEAVILQHPDIVDAAVIGVKLHHDADNPRDAEHPRAYVVNRESAAGSVSATEADVKDWCAQRLAKYKALSGGVVFLHAIPRNAGGKLLKRILREQAAEEIAIASSKAKL